MKRVIVSVTNDLITDQRVAKTCDVLLSLKYEVLLVGRKLKNSHPVSRAYQTKRFSLVFNSSFLFYAEYNIRLFFFLLGKKKHLLFSNDLDTLPANYLVSILQKKKLVYDSHELFTEIPELVKKPLIKKCWLGIEKILFPNLKNVMVVSDAIADFYTKKYGVLCNVIRNLPQVFTIEPGVFPFEKNAKKVILYQGAVNIGRGLELIIDTMPLLENYLLVIIGDGDIFTTLKEDTAHRGLENKIFFLGKKSPEELKKLTPLADIGISLEEDMGLNYRYALPNKLFDYIHAEIPVVVSNLPEMKKIVAQYSVGKILEERSSEKLASLLLSIDKPKYTNVLKKAKEELNWNMEKEKLILIFEHLS
ncbi:MAG: glycosyltransferase [Flavobacteriaceae bacterium]|nr:MAG: glycosyltransferase [Flavobacteriaceae bacterium]